MKNYYQVTFCWKICMSCSVYKFLYLHLWTFARFLFKNIGNIEAQNFMVRVWSYRSLRLQVDQRLRLLWCRINFDLMLAEVQLASFGSFMLLKVSQCTVTQFKFKRTLVFALYLLPNIVMYLLWTKYILFSYKNKVL